MTASATRCVSNARSTLRSPDSLWADTHHRNGLPESPQTLAPVGARRKQIQPPPSRGAYFMTQYLTSVQSAAIRPAS